MSVLGYIYLSLGKGYKACIGCMNIKCFKKELHTRVLSFISLYCQKWGRPEDEGGVEDWLILYGMTK